METYCNNPYAARRAERRASAGADADRRAARRPAAPRDAAPRGRGRSRAGISRSGLMRYAADNRIVQTVYHFTTGPWRAAFYAAVVLAVAVGVYFPVRDLYAAYRTNGILESQLSVRKAYNDELSKSVDRLLSTEGIEAIARERLGLVMPGEHAVNVVGIDDSSDVDGASGDGSAAGGDASSSSDAPSTSAEVSKAEAAAQENAPWYLKVLDVIFCYQGAGDQTVSSTGE